ncbi:MAG: MBOAT family protein [Bacteroidales bacterium]|nr:MBOAT family protein [Bacteroidales bacterium]
MDILKDILLYSEAKPLLFTRLYFWGFYALLLVIYSVIYKKNPLRNAYLFFISLFFYYKSGGYFFTLLIFSTIADFTLGQLIYSAKTSLKKKLFVATSIIINLSLLGYFKYTYFFTDIINTTFHSDFEVINYLASWTNSLTGSSFDISIIILPVGISFYTFQTISYTVDVYRKKLKPVKNIIDFGFYVSFFPQLVAGPIERSTRLLPQLVQKYNFDYDRVTDGLKLMLWGFFKKIVIADRVAVIVNQVYNNPSDAAGLPLLIGTYLFAFQIYCDFSGYSDIAIGAAQVFGINLMQNFRRPYFAKSIREFWQRWHISLSTWFRDYLYQSLGGSRTTRWRWYYNIMIVFLISGLWHGGNWTFVIWGGLHGSYYLFSYYCDIILISF